MMSCCAGTLAQSSTPPSNEDPGSADDGGNSLDRLTSHLMESRRLLGDPWGARSALEDRGLFLDAYFNHQFGYNARGGVNTHAARRHSASFDYFARFDTGRAGLFEGGQALMQAKTNRNANINPDVGALSAPIDDADFDEDLYIDQLWYEHAFLDGSVRARFGYVDLQTIIDRNVFANSEDTQFMSTFLDNNNATIPLKIGFGAALWLRPTDWLQVITGVSDADNQILHAGFDTAFDDFESLLVYGEASVRHELSSATGALPGNYRVGVFYDPRTRAILNSGGRVDTGDAGVYSSFDQLILREGADDNQGLGWFLRYGYRDDETNRITHSWSTGIQYLGPLPGRDADACGAAVYQAILSERLPGDFSRETGVELYYRVQVTDWFALTPGFQFIDNPGGRRSARDAQVFVLRSRISF